MTSITTGPGHGERAPLDPFAQRYHVYHLYDADGALLYVGRLHSEDVGTLAQPAHNIDGVVRHTGRKIEVA